MSHCQISIQRQSLLAIGNPLGRAVRTDFDDAEIQVGHGVFWSHGQSLGQGRFGRREACDPVVGHHAGTTCRIDNRGAHQRLDITGIELQCAFEKARACAIYSGVAPLFTQAMPSK